MADQHLKALQRNERTGNRHRDVLDGIVNIGHGGIGAGGHKSVLCIEGHDHHDAQTQTYQIGDVPHDLGSNTMQAGDKEIQPDQTGLVVQGDDAD